MAKRRGHGEGGIYQRESDGKWCASVDLGFVNGKRRRKVIYGKTRKEVADKLKALHRDQASGVHLAIERQTVETFLLRWLDDVVSQRNKARTQDSYRTTVQRHIVPTLGHYQLDQLRPEHVPDHDWRIAGAGISSHRTICADNPRPSTEPGREMAAAELQSCSSH